MTAYKNKHHEEYEREGGSTIDLLNATPSLVSGAIKHDLVPILSRRKGKQEQEWVHEVFEVLNLTIHHFSSDHLGEQEVAQHWEHEVDKH